MDSAYGKAFAKAYDEIRTTLGHDLTEEDRPTIVTRTNQILEEQQASKPKK
jgi:hypothetical protein